MAWHPTLSNMESKADPPWNRPKPITDTQRREDALAVIGTYDVCWCGLPAYHEWDGENDGAPHPR